MVEFFISKRIVSGNKGFSKPIVNIAILGIALGLAVMIITIAVITGFQKEIREKVIGFGSHIQITNFDNNESYEASPIDRNQSFIAELNKNPSIRHIQSFATKAGIIKTKTELQGIVMKGVGNDFDWDFFKKNIVEGGPLHFSDSAASGDVIISKFHSEKLHLHLNDSVIFFFIQNQSRNARKLRVCGIYETGMGDMFDKTFVLADIAHVQRLNGWNKNQAAGFEILINDYKKLDETTKFVNETIGYNFLARSIKDLNRQVFSWLDSFDSTAAIVISITLLVAIINMISALLILILDKTNLIGTIKALGMTNWGVQKIFLWNAAYLLGRGLLWGNVIGISLCLLQQHLHILPLDERSYYVSYVAVNINPAAMLLLNGIVFSTCIVTMLLPCLIITYITPVKAMRFS